MILIYFILLLFTFSKPPEWNSIDLLKINSFDSFKSANSYADTSTNMQYIKRIQDALRNRDTMAIFHLYCFGKDVGERNPKLGLISADTILQIASELNNTRGKISAYNLKGIMYTITDDYNKSLANFNKALEVANSNLNNNYQSFIDKHAISYYYIGALYTKRKEYQTALNNYLKALKIINKLTERDLYLEDSLKNNVRKFYYTTYKNDKLDILYSVANTYYLLNILDSSNYYLDLCLSSEVNYTDYNILVKIEYLKANYYYNKNKYIEVKKHLNKSLFAANKINNKEYIIKSNLLFYKISNNPKYLFDALSNSKKIKSLKDQADISLTISKHFQNTKDYKKSNEYLNNYILLINKLNSVETERKFGKLESDLEYKFKLKSMQQDKQIAEAERKISSQRVLILISFLALSVLVLLIVFRLNIQKKKYISIIESKQKELESLNKQLKELNISKIKLFSIISHDLKSPIKEFELGTKSLLSNIDNSNLSNESRKNIEYLHKLSSDISKLLLSLLDWGKSQIESSTISNNNIINIQNIINEIIELYNFNINKKKLNINVNILNSELKYEENDIKIVLRNIIQNAIKFSIIGGEIDICSYIEDEYYIITISNEGQSISEQNLQKIDNLELPSVSNGIDYETGSGFGLIKVNEILNSIGGNLILENTHNGVKAYIYLKYT